MFNTYRSLLFDLNEANVKIKRLESKSELIRSRLEGMTGTSYDTEIMAKYRTKKDNSCLFDDLLEVEKEIERYKKHRNNINLLIQETDDFVKDFNKEERDVFYYRFVRNLQVNEVARMVPYSLRQVERIIQKIKAEAKLAD